MSGVSFTIGDNSAAAEKLIQLSIQGAAMVAAEAVKNSTFNLNDEEGLKKFSKLIAETKLALLGGSTSGSK